MCELINKITKSELCDLIINNREILIRFFEEKKYAISLLKCGEVHINTLNNFRETEDNNYDPSEGIITSNKIYNAKIKLKDENLHYISDVHVYENLNNYVYCMVSYSKQKYSELRKDDVLKSITELQNSQGKYIVVFYDRTSFVDGIKNNTEVEFLKADEVDYVDNYDRSNAFQKMRKYKDKDYYLEYEYRILFKNNSNAKESFNIYIKHKSKQKIFEIE